MSNFIHQSEAQGNFTYEKFTSRILFCEFFFVLFVLNLALTEELEMELSKEPGDQKNREYFKRQKLPWLRSYLLERGIQISSDGKNKRKAEVVDLAVNDAHEMKLAKVCDGESEFVDTAGSFTNQ